MFYAFLFGSLAASMVLAVATFAACTAAMIVDLYRFAGRWFKLPRRTDRGSVDIPRLSRLERDIVAANPAGRPWTRADIMSTPRRVALARWHAVRAALGLSRQSARLDIATTSNVPGRKNGNAKLTKTDAVTGGITLLPADGAARWARERPVALAVFCAAMGIDADAFATYLARLTVCARSTAGCRAGCVITTTGRAELEQRAAANRGTDPYGGDIFRGRLARTLLLAVDPAAYLRLTVDAVDALADIGRQHGMPRRWRLAVADDIRYELVAPGLLTAMGAGSVRPYAYTKFRPDDRPAPRGVALTYSASERWTVRDILTACDAGHRVAVVLDTPRGADLPPTWLGRRVVDGDATDDQHAHPAGTIVALRAKGAAVGGRFIFPTAERDALERMARDGYSPKMGAAAPVIVRRRPRA
jgi:hypothetical protein